MPLSPRAKTMGLTAIGLATLVGLGAATVTHTVRIDAVQERTAEDQADQEPVEAGEPSQAPSAHEDGALSLEPLFEEDLSPGQSTKREIGSSRGHSTYRLRFTLPRDGVATQTIRLRNTAHGRYDVVLRREANGQRLLRVSRVQDNARTVLEQLRLPRGTGARAIWLHAEVQDEPGGDRLWASTWFDGEDVPQDQISVKDTGAALSTKQAKALVLVRSDAGNEVDYEAKVAGAIVKDVDETNLSPGRWGSPVLRSDFDAAAPFSDWTIRDRTYVHYDASYVVGSNVRAENGAAVLSTRRVSEPWVMKDGVERHYSSAYLDSIKTFSQAYGRWEIRAKLPTVKDRSRGIWPAFWLRPDDGGDGEIDVLEAYGTPSKRSSAIANESESTVHFPKDENADRRKATIATPADIDVNDGRFHTWALEWSPDGMTFFLDGAAYFTLTPQDDPSWKKLYGSARPYNMRLNVQVGSSFAGWPNTRDTAARTDFVVDHVRVWDWPKGS